MGYTMVRSLVQRLNGFLVVLGLLCDGSQALQGLMHVVFRQHSAIVCRQGGSDAQLKFAKAGVTALIALEWILQCTK